MAIFLQSGEVDLSESAEKYSILKFLIFFEDGLF